MNDREAWHSDPDRIRSVGGAPTEEIEWIYTTFTCQGNLTETE